MHNRVRMQEFAGVCLYDLQVSGEKFPVFQTKDIFICIVHLLNWSRAT